MDDPSPCSFPRLEIISPATPHTFLLPAKRIHDGGDVPRFLVSYAYSDIGVFILQLTRALCPRIKSRIAAEAAASRASRLSSPSSRTSGRTFTLNAVRENFESINHLRKLLETIEGIIDEAPPDPGPRRFGNVSFRKWHKLVEERVEKLLRDHLPEATLSLWANHGYGGEEQMGPLVELKAYFMGGFGSAQRLDYGTGHELSFLAFLACIWKLGGFSKDGNGEEIERSIVLDVFEPYLRVIRRLIRVYTLEPAGSHGVWGLDDHSFMPYIFGSSQLARPIEEHEPIPQKGSVPGAPKPCEIMNPVSVEKCRTENMYFSAIGFINDVKKGPFWEHSPMLFDISGIKDGWGKINKGMIKMFNAEVLSKFPVVQHFPFGSLLSWDINPEAIAPLQSVHMASQPGKESASGGVGVTKAPWATSESIAPTLPRGWARDTGPTPSTALPDREPDSASTQYSVTKAPWAK